MGGIAILILLLTYFCFIVIGVGIAFRLGSWPVGIAALVMLILLPLADAQLGRVVLGSKCETEGKTVVSESIPNVEGFAQYSVFRDSPGNYGYRFVETDRRTIYADPVRFGDSPTFYERAEVEGHGKDARLVKDANPRAKYRLDIGPRGDSLYFYRTRTSIREIATDRELSGFTWFEFRGGWAERVLSSLTDAGARPVADCGGIDVQIKMTKELLHATLLPAP